MNRRQRGLDEIFEAELEGTNAGRGYLSVEEVSEVESPPSSVGDDGAGSIGLVGAGVLDG